MVDTVFIIYYSLLAVRSSLIVGPCDGALKTAQAIAT